MKVGSQVNYIVLGNGRWSNNYRKSLILNSLPENIIDFDIYNRSSFDFTKLKKNVIIVATHPKLQSNYINFFNKISVPMILEKPLCYDENSYNVLLSRLKNNQNSTLAGFFNLLNHNLFLFKKKLYENWPYVQKLFIYEGSNGPKRKDLNAFYDWAPHVFALIQSLLPNEFVGDLKKREGTNGDIYELNGQSAKVQVFSKFGNGFQSKKRLVCAQFQNGKRIYCDFTSPKNEKKREMDRMLIFSKNYFFKEKYKSYRIFSKFYKNDDFLKENAKLTLLFGNMIR